MKLPNDKETWENDVLSSLLAKALTAGMLQDVYDQDFNEPMILYNDYDGQTHFISLRKMRQHILTEGYTTNDKGKG